MVLVASYNIRKAVGTDRQRRPDRIIEVLAEIGPDVVALQEADRRFGTRLGVLPTELMAERLGLVPVPLDVRPGSHGWHGNVILVPRTAEVLAHHALALPTLEPRGAVVADVALPHGPLRVVGMHLDLSGLMRRRQTAAIIEALAAMPPMRTVLMGDLNEWRRHRGCLRDLSDHYVLAATGPSFHARQPVARLDRIMVSRDLAVTECGAHHSALARLASDHLPIWARLAAG